MNDKTLSIIIAAEDKASKTMARVGDNIGDMASKVANATKIAAAATGAALAAIGIATVKSTAELEQNLGGALTVFGDWSLDLEEKARDSFSSMGTSMSQYLNTANKMGSLFQGAGFSVSKSFDLTNEAMQRATDVATAMGISTDMALESIAGAAKGNFTMMDNLGVAMSATSIEAYALSKGITKTYDAMTNQEKVGYAMQMFMEKTAKYAGNYARENDTLAGSLQTVKGAWDNFMSGVDGGGEQLGRSLSNMAKVYSREVPKIMGTLIKSTGDLYHELRASNPEFKKYTDIAVNTFNTISDVVRTTVSIVKTFLPIIVGVTAALVAYRAVVLTANAVTAAHSALIYLAGTRYLVMNGSIVAVRNAVTLATVAQGAWNAVLAMNPIGLVVGGLAALVGIMAVVLTSTNNNKSASDRLNEARRVQAEHADRAKEAEDRLRDAQLGVERATLNVEIATKAYNSAVRDYGIESLEARQAALDLKDANGQLENQTKTVKGAIDEQTTSLDLLGSKLDKLNGKSVSYNVRGVNMTEWSQDGKRFIGPQFSTGGYTGRGGRDEVAGTVHKGEYVVPKSQVDQSTGLPKIGGTSVTVNMLGTTNMNSQADIETFANRVAELLNSKREMGSYGVGL